MTWWKFDEEGSWGHPWGALKWTKMDQNGHYSMTKKKIFWTGPQWLIWSISGLNEHLKGDRSQNQSWRVVGSPMRCTKMDQNGLKWTEVDLIGHYSMTKKKFFRICPQWLIWSISGLNGHLKGDRSQKQSWRGGGVTHEVHQNRPK